MDGWIEIGNDGEKIPVEDVRIHVDEYHEEFDHERREKIKVADKVSLKRQIKKINYARFFKSFRRINEKKPCTSTNTGKRRSYLQKMQKPNLHTPRSKWRNNALRI